ncbi:cytochrome c oxidase assembly protein [Palleronia sp.]|uniref:cytochrome c oxidase assembly protein n=1 Tax=Palleronia sp. TaxID=1940284 RepID=UPI0035C8198D
MPVRGAALILAVVVLLALYVLPLDPWVGPFPAHMIRHMALVAVVPPLLVLGLPPFPAPPVLVAAVIEFAAVWGWHAPALHEAAYFRPAIFVLEQVSFLAVGVMIWASALRTAEPLAGAGGMLLTSMHMTLLGALLILSPKALYAYCGPGQQQIGGMIMLGIGTIVYLVAGLWLTARALTAEEAAS